MCVSDKALVAMLEPEIVTVLVAGESVTSQIAYIKKYGDRHKYLDMRKNVVFFSDHSDAENAYTDHCKKLGEMKNKKLQFLMQKNKNDNSMMVKIMKCCIVSYIEMVEAGPENQSNLDISRLLADPGLFGKVVTPYFSTGISLNVFVNNPRGVYEECLLKHRQEILDVVNGESRLSQDETLIYSEASLNFEQ